MKIKGLTENTLVNRPRRVHLLDKKSWDDLKVGQDYKWTLHAGDADVWGYIRVTDDTTTKRFGHKKRVVFENGYGSSTNISDWDQTEFDDDVPTSISRKFDRMERDLVIKEGDILYGSWGYNMTTPEFYKVVRRRGKSVSIQRLHKIEKHNRSGNYYAMPIVNDPADPPETRRILKDGLREYVKTTNTPLRLWDGKRKRGTDYD